MAKNEPVKGESLAQLKSNPECFTSYKIKMGAFICHGHIIHQSKIKIPTAANDILFLNQYNVRQLHGYSVGRDYEFNFEDNDDPEFQYQLRQILYDKYMKCKNKDN